MFRRIIQGIVMTIPLVFLGCSDSYVTSPEPLYKGTFCFEAKYDYIRSQIGGGGIFLVRIIPGGNFEGTVDLEIRADPCLNARLNRKTLDQSSTVAEITVAPDNTADFKTYPIEVRASHQFNACSIFLEVEVLQWPCGVSDDAALRMAGFIEWVKEKYPQLGDISSIEWNAYPTYPQIWIVEHCTFLSSEWEIRLCHHVMIPPYDWSYFRLRKRGEYGAVLAARQDSDSQPLHEIEVEEYPIMYGY